jgi:hypothetical protein
MVMTAPQDEAAVEPESGCTTLWANARADGDRRFEQQKAAREQSRTWRGIFTPQP